MRAGAAGLALALIAASAPAPEIEVLNEAGVAPAELESMVADFRLWGGRVYAYHERAPAPVTLKLTRAVPFGFYRDGVVMLPPGERQAMLEDWVHELTHHVLGRDSSFYFREGAATHTVEALLTRERMTPQGWPYFGKSCDAWTRLFEARKARVPLAQALDWPGYQRDKDFESWQLYLTGCSFIGWYRSAQGAAAWRETFTRGRPAGDLAALEQAWLAHVQARRLPTFDPAAVLPRSDRYRKYAERLK